ncbi:MAG TPA: helix-hairpin-helix domain-containing protein [Gemmatimonadaceae bacterium]|nr:helix-hairpin-helix domain-containing protein [Gemmatimonadaceae bacterium]
MDSRTAAHTLSQIAAYLELQGENRFKSRAYQLAARGLRNLGADDLAPLYRSGELGQVPGLGPATLAVIGDLIETGESRYLEQLRQSTPEGLLALLRVPGLGPEKIHKIHRELGVQTVEELEEAARSGRLSAIPRFGPRTAEKILAGIAFMRESETLMLWHHAAAEAERLLAMVRQHPDIASVVIAGAVRRRCEVVGEIDIVGACTPGADPTGVAASFSRVGGVRRADGVGTPHVRLHFVDGTRCALHCASAEHAGLALWRATGSATHEALVVARLAERRIAIVGDELRDAAGKALPAATEREVYRAARLAFVPAELREGTGEVDAAARRTLPTLIEEGDIQGVLHCHTHYSDGKASVLEMAEGARARGWRYLGVSDHSAAAFYAGGLSREEVLAQHEEIDEVNDALAPSGFKVLKGIEADILADGRLDYDETLLDRFDYVIGSIHSRFSMNGAAMTARVLRALDDPHLTVLAHPTGRLLLSREPYALDVESVLARAGEVGVAVELNADPHRLDLDWRYLPDAKRHGVSVAIGPDAHSVSGLDNVPIGVGLARKGWLEAGDVLNAQSAEAVLAFARARKGR